VKDAAEDALSLDAKHFSQRNFQLALAKKVAEAHPSTINIVGTYRIQGTLDDGTKLSGKVRVSPYKTGTGTAAPGAYNLTVEYQDSRQNFSTGVSILKGQTLYIHYFNKARGDESYSAYSIQPDGSLKGERMIGAGKRIREALVADKTLDLPDVGKEYAVGVYLLPRNRMLHSSNCKTYKKNRTEFRFDCNYYDRSNPVAGTQYYEGEATLDAKGMDIVWEHHPYQVAAMRLTHEDYMDSQYSGEANAVLAGSGDTARVSISLGRKGEVWKDDELSTQGVIDDLVVAAKARSPEEKQRIERERKAAMEKSVLSPFAGRWKGFYRCQRGNTAIDLEIKVGSEGNAAVLSFGQNSGHRDLSPGKILYDMQIQPGSGRTGLHTVNFKPVKWLKQSKQHLFTSFYLTQHSNDSNSLQGVLNNFRCKAMVLHRN
jgi:hypothetical protein